MGQINKKILFKDLLLFILIAFSTFEYFFRSTTPMYFFNLFVILIFLKSGIKLSSRIILLFIPFVIVFSLQAICLTGYSFLGVFGRVFTIFSCYCLAIYIGPDLKKCFIHVLSFITTYSLVIFVVTQNPTINELFINKICSNFQSLNYQTAIQEGGGINCVIFNFQRNAIGFNTLGVLYRNSGPFWEPGLFAVFLNIALFFNLIFYKKWYISIVLIIGIITTFSAGGYFALLYVLFSYTVIIGRNNFFRSILFLGFLLYLITIMGNLDFVGVKILDQLDNATIGSDESRFGALLTQLKMITDSPIIGGMMISNYTTSDTLASGFLLPIVNYGVFLGLLYYFLLLKSSINISKGDTRNSKTGYFLFGLFIVLSISQTILLSMAFIVIMLNGLTNKKNTYV